jgi:hypothetical protein
MVEIVAADERPPALDKSLRLQSPELSNDFQLVWRHPSVQGIGKSIRLVNPPSKPTTQEAGVQSQF